MAQRMIYEGHCHGCNRITNQEAAKGVYECLNPNCRFVNAKLHKIETRRNNDIDHQWLECADCGRTVRH